MNRLDSRHSAAAIPREDATSTVQGNHVTTHPDVLLGRPVVAGTRIAVDEVLEKLAGSDAPEMLHKLGIHPDLTPSAIQAVLRFAADSVRAASPIGESDPLELHGAHTVTVTGPDGCPREAVSVRAFAPGAEAAVLRRPAETVHPMERVHPAGVFEALFPAQGAPENYQVAITLSDGRTVLTDDPYGLPPYTTEETVLREMRSACASGSDSKNDAPNLDVDVPAGHALPVGTVCAPSGDSASAGGAESPADPAPGRATRPQGRLYDILGARPVVHAGHAGVAFAVWAPNATGVSVVGNFNRWNHLCHPMRPVGGTGIWELFVPGLGAGELYKYRICSGVEGRWIDKADPFAFAAEVRPRTASLVWDLKNYFWNDADWLAKRADRQALDRPIAIYEVHLGSWRRKVGPASEMARRSIEVGPLDDGAAAGTPGEAGFGQQAGSEAGAGGWLTYRELADSLIPYVKDLGYTHIEPMPVAEHPFDGSWGYQVTGYFAPTARYGSPDDFRYFVDRAHQAGLGVIFDWVPGHFPKDEHGLSLFDGTHLFEHSDPRRRENLEWGTSSFDLEREEVRQFLMSSAAFWLREYHIDGIRVDAVSSMVYLDYSRQHWVPNRFGGRENLDATEFLQNLNELVHREFPGVLSIAEESTAWPRVTGPDKKDSLGFDLKWNLGWMHDTLGYLQRDPVHRRHHHNEITFSLVYAFNENFLLPYSHDEVVHGKRSMLSKMPGDEWQKFANLRATYGFMYGHPGKKLHFMGAEFGQLREWSEDRQLDWALLEFEPHAKLREFVRDLNRLYTSRPALFERDFSWEGFQWLNCNDADQSVVSFIRRGKRPEDFVVVVVNFTPVPRNGHRLGVPVEGSYREALNSDLPRYGGSGVRNPAKMAADPVPADGQGYSVNVSLPPLAVIFIERVSESETSTRRTRKRAQMT